MVRSAFEANIVLLEYQEMATEQFDLNDTELNMIANVFKTRKDEVMPVSVLKKGMTNQSCLFSIGGRKYILRRPGAGTNKLIDRKQEKAVFDAIKGRGFCDAPVYLDPENGYKITEFLEGVRECDKNDPYDLERCMAKLRSLHEMELKVSHSFDLFKQLEFYESLRQGRKSVYSDHEETKGRVLALKEYIEEHVQNRCLAHIDAVPDNFLFYSLEGEEKLQLTDWEYAGMQDPHVDIAMFCIYSLYDKPQIDRLIRIYFQGPCDTETRIKIYCYIAVCGLLWSEWCEYKSMLGVEFGEYSICQYYYAKDFSLLAKEELS